MVTPSRNSMATNFHPVLQLGALNRLFVLGRSIGFIGHFIDQKRMSPPCLATLGSRADIPRVPSGLKQPLYRHPAE